MMSYHQDTLLHSIRDACHVWFGNTQVWQNATLDEATGQELFFKCELLQKSGSFKYRVRRRAKERCLSPDSAEAFPQTKMYLSDSEEEKCCQSLASTMTTV